ncbi:MAG TPA: hypothetical protein PKZ80_04110 [Thermoleophilia bacterium]|jgi:hypothetical protein|nr:hypothetical protein [Actinomycetota bacterium]OPZ45332.1 MAG: hypothetical protein BWY94_01417 [Actinobacteria bacterium ADurb.BinA094]HQJ26399.1 hypothetical protein [Thermoleophilia bacterium]
MARRGPILGGVVAAALGVVLAPRRGESRREAVERLRLAVRSGRGAVGAFAGTPCAVRDQPAPHAQGALGTDRRPAAVTTRGGDDDG